ncbi:MAG: SDR family NAD(P)-dependent oxidoreductase [Gemmatimonadota bacterium]
MRGAPITKKAPGDRQLASAEVAAIAALIASKAAEGHVSDLAATRAREIAAAVRKHAAIPLLERLYPGKGATMTGRIARILEKGEIRISVVDLGDRTGFPRENARPACEVLLFRRGDALRPPDARGRPAAKGETPHIFLTAAFVAKSGARPSLLLQAVVHPILEWVFGLPHMVAVLCESALDASPADPSGSGVSDLNRFIAEQAGRDRDFAYFDRILGTAYEPDEFRMEELAAQFGGEDARITEVVLQAREMGRRFRGLMEEILAATRAEIAREQIAAARKSLDEGDADAALTILRPLVAAGDAAASVQEEAGDLIGLSVRSYALDADPAYEGLSMQGKDIRVEPWAGRKARAFAELLAEAAQTVAAGRETAARNQEGDAPPAPGAGGGAARTIHVTADLERPSAKFIDGHDRVHWIFERSFVEALLAGRDSGHSPRGIPAILACRIVRDDAFPDEKLKIENQYAAAVKGAVAAYRFYQGLPPETTAEMAASYESAGAADPLYRLFVSLGGETNPARASHLIRRSVARTHSYNYVRYPETPLAGQVVVVTGGGTGMGRALAMEAAIQGANVVITGRRSAPLEETRADMDALVRHLGLTNQTLAVQGDVSDPKYVGEMFERIAREFGRIDVLYNNAGVSGPVEFGSVYREEQFEQYRETLGIHLTGAWLASLEAASVMENSPGGGTIVMVGTFYTESIHRHVLHAYPGRLPYTSAQSAKLALGDYLAWMLAGKNIAVLSLNPAAVATERIRRGSGVFDKGARARARVGRRVSPESLEKDTLNRTVGREFVHPRDFARVALEMLRPPFRRTLGGQRLPMGGVTYEQPPGVIPSPAALGRYPDMVGKVALLTVHRPIGNDLSLVDASARALARSGANVVLAGDRVADLEDTASRINASGGEGMATVTPVSLADIAEVQALLDGLPRLDLLLHFTGSVDWKRPLTNLPFEDWSAAIDRFGYVPRVLCWQAERRMDRDRTDGTIALVGPDASGIPSIRERNLVQVFQAMLRPAVATESMERALMRKAHAEGAAPFHVSDVNIGLILPGRTDGRNKAPDASRLAATVLWLLEDAKRVSGAVLLPDEQNTLARLPAEPRVGEGSMAGKVVVVTGGIRNLGKEISLRFATEGATVVVASRRPRAQGTSPEESANAQAALAAGDQALALMRGAGGRAIWVDADVSRPRSVRALIDEARNRFGRIDAFVNNAGAGGDFSLLGDVLREHRDSWHAVLRSNFLGPWAATVALRDIMRRQDGGGTIVNVSTHYADHPYLFRTIYTVSKILLKSLTLAGRAALAADNIRIADVAPSLIAGPRMDWVMRHYAGKFAAQIEGIKELGAAERAALQEHFVRAFDRALPPAERRAAEAAFRSSVRDSRLSRARRAELETWQERIREWFARTVPVDPPTNGQVADAVLFAAKNARFLEDRFIGVSSLERFAPFPEPPARRAGTLGGEAYVLVAAGEVRGVPAGEAGGASLLGEELERAGARVTALFEAPGPTGPVTVVRPAPPAGRGAGRRLPERMERELDLEDPRIVEPWLDSSLFGGPPPAGAILFFGTTAAGRSILRFTPDEMERTLSHLGKALNVFAECLRAVREGGHVIVVAPPDGTEEGQVVRAALRQIVRTSAAERRFLPSGKSARLSLLSSPGGGDGREFVGRLIEILSGASPPCVEPVPVGRVLA